MSVRANPVKTALAAGGRAFGAMVFEFFTPGTPQLCRNAGAEFVLFDMRARVIRRKAGAAPHSDLPTTITGVERSADKIAALHARTLLIAQIESVEGLQSVEAIACR